MKNSRTKTPIGKPSRNAGGSGLKDLDVTSGQGYHEPEDLSRDTTPDPSLVRHPNRNTDKGSDDQGRNDKLAEGEDI
ncbi:hypothetical protein [Pedobacter sp. SYP-B3415]|uniref:hypothetical protein n=1 Tax=Pedobacter sp. SYP-B3415 TaxID=2496641 RepID=UPI00101C47AC|nr:hypothetical protein [Pedobacter sp. SYP-B3415]